MASDLFSPEQPAEKCLNTCLSFKRQHFWCYLVKRLMQAFLAEAAGSRDVMRRVLKPSEVRTEEEHRH